MPPNKTSADPTTPSISHSLPAIHPSSPPRPTATLPERQEIDKVGDRRHSSTTTTDLRRWNEGQAIKTIFNFIFYPPLPQHQLFGTIKVKIRGSPLPPLLPLGSVGRKSRAGAGAGGVYLLIYLPVPSPCSMHDSCLMLEPSVVIVERVSSQHHESKSPTTWERKENSTSAAAAAAAALQSYKDWGMGQGREVGIPC